MGCLYFNQHKYPAARGYGYVGVSRFRSRAGCFLYGKLRVTDFLPVGEPKEDEVTERGYLSASVASDDDDFGMEYAFQGGGGVVDDTDSDASIGHAPAEDLANAFQGGIIGLFGEDAEEAQLSYVDIDF